MSAFFIAVGAIFVALYAIGAMLGLVAAAFSRSGRYDENSGGHE